MGQAQLPVHLITPRLELTDKWRVVWKIIKLRSSSHLYLACENFLRELKRTKRNKELDLELRLNSLMIVSITFILQGKIILVL